MIPFADDGIKGKLLNHVTRTAELQSVSVCRDEFSRGAVGLSRGASKLVYSENLNKLFQFFYTCVGYINDFEAHHCIVIFIFFHPST